MYQNNFQSWAIFRRDNFSKSLSAVRDHFLETSRWHYSALGSRWGSYVLVGSYLLILLPSWHLPKKVNNIGKIKLRRLSFYFSPFLWIGADRGEAGTTSLLHLHILPFSYNYVFLVLLKRFYARGTIRGRRILPLAKIPFFIMIGYNP